MWQHMYTIFHGFSDFNMRKQNKFLQRNIEFLIFN